MSKKKSNTRTKQKKRCESGKHIFSGEDWVKIKRPFAKHFICRRCQEKIPFIDLPSKYFHREMEKARTILSMIIFEIEENLEKGKPK